MKLQLFLISVCFTSLLTACSKNSDDIDLTGKWELASHDGGLGGSHDFPPGNGNTIEFTSTTYIQTIHYADTTYQLSGTYSFHRGKPCDISSKVEQQIRLGEVDFVFSYGGQTFRMGFSPDCISDAGFRTYRRL